MTTPKIHTLPDKSFLVDGAFLDKLMLMYGQRMLRVPYGYHLYPDNTGLNEIWLIKHDPVEELGAGKPTWKVITQPDRGEVFRGITEEVMKRGNQKMARQRLVSDMNIEKFALLKNLEDVRVAGKSPSGLYGYTRKIQAMCESAERRLQRKAGSLIKKASRRDQRTLEFLGTHAKRAKSVPAKLLITAFKDGIPKLGSGEFDTSEGDEGCSCGGTCGPCQAVGELRQAADSIEKTREDIFNVFKKHSYTMEKKTWENEIKSIGGGGGSRGSNMVRQIFNNLVKEGKVISQGTKWVLHRSMRLASTRIYSMYGYPIKTAELSLQACNDLRIEAGHIAADMHQRQAAMYENITGYLQANVKTAKSLSSRLLLSVYPEQQMFRTASTQPEVEDWLSLDPEF